MLDYARWHIRSLACQHGALDAHRHGGFAIGERLQQVSDDLLRLNQGTLYPALLRLEPL